MTRRKKRDEGSSRGGEPRGSDKAGIGNVPDPTPGDHEHPDVARRDWPLFRDRPPGSRPDPGATGRGVRRDPGASPEDVSPTPGPERGAVKGGPSAGGARQGGEARDTQPRDVAGDEGAWKNAGQGAGGGRPGRNFGNAPDVKEGDEVRGPDLGRSPAAGARAGGARVIHREEDEP